MVQSTRGSIRVRHPLQRSGAATKQHPFVCFLLCACLAGQWTGCGSGAGDDARSPDEGAPHDDESSSSGAGDASRSVDSDDAQGEGAGRRDASSASDERASENASDGGRSRPEPSRDAPEAGTDNAFDGGPSASRDAAAARDADVGSSRSDAASGDSGGVATDETCSLPTVFRWKGGGPLAQPKNGWLSMKDVAHAFHGGQHILYFTTFQTGWGAGMMTFKDWGDAAGAPQTKLNFGIAPTLFYFSPKKLWVIAYQWGAHKFSYRTSSDPANPSGWSEERALYRAAVPAGSPGPIDQTVICDDRECFLYYAADNGHIYKSSLPIASFPGEFPAGSDSGIVGTTQNLFEGVQVYRVKGQGKYLMIVEAQGSARYFRAFTATGLDGPWSLLTNDFAVKKSVALTPNWTNDISHGDLVRTTPDETFTVDPCHLQMVFQGRDPAINTEYGRLPYRLGLLTLER